MSDLPIAEEEKIRTTPGRYLSEWMAQICPVLMFGLICAGTIHLWRAGQPSPLPANDQVTALELIEVLSGAPDGSVVEPGMPFQEGAGYQLPGQWTAPMPSVQDRVRWAEEGGSL